MLSRSWAYLRSLLGSASAKNTGTNGDAVPLLSGRNSWSQRQAISSATGDVPAMSVGGVNPILLVCGNSASASGIANIRFSNDSLTPVNVIGKSRAGVVGVPGVAVISGDMVGRLSWAADSGSVLEDVARIESVVDGAVLGGIRPPARLSLSASDGVGGLPEALRIDSSGGVQVRPAMSGTSPGRGQLLARGLQVDVQSVSSTGAIAALASDTGLVRLTGAAPDVQGITAPTLGARMLWLYCASATTLRHASASAAAANRIATASGLDLVVTAGSTVRLIYDTTSAVWRV